jgi:hypothetical protein
MNVIREYSKSRTQGKLVEVDEKTYEVEVYYNEGGMNYFAGQVEKRGYYLSVTPVELGDGWKRYTAFSGTKVLLDEVKRFSQKRMSEIAAQFVLNHPTVQNVFQHVLAKR